MKSALLLALVIVVEDLGQYPALAAENPILNRTPSANNIAMRVRIKGVILDRPSNSARRFGRARNQRGAAEILNDLQTSGPTTNGNANSQTDFALVGTNGFTYLECISKEFDSIVSALTNRGRFRILSKPRIVTATGTAATMFLGDTAPYVFASGTEKLSWKPQLGTGATLRFTPTLDAQDRITVHIHQRIEETATGEAGESHIVSCAESQAKVTTRLGQTIVLSGCLTTSGKKRPREMIALIGPSIVVDSDPRE